MLGLTWKRLLLVVISILVAFIAVVLHHQPESEKDYPDLGKTIQELIESRGFAHETHFIESSDGYILQAVRIVNPHVRDRSALKPVLLHHGFQCSGSLWLVAADGQLKTSGEYIEEWQGKEDTVGNSLGFVLSAKGYDVWLANYRGNIYSRNHTKLSPEEDAFWRYSLDEMIGHDLPAQINYIRAKTGRKSISYIGHSQGNFMMFGLLASQPHFADVIKPHIALSPVSYHTHSKSVLRMFASLRKQLLRFKPHDIFTNGMRKLSIPRLCTNPILSNICYRLYYRLLGSPRDQMSMDRLPIYFDNVLHGSATRNYVQFLQMKVQPMHYDYSDEEDGHSNMQKYKQDFPPIYRYSAINSTDIAIFYTKTDWFNHIADIHLFKQNINVPLLDDFAVPDPSWNHMDLLWAKDVGKVVNSRILAILDKY